MHDTNIAFPLSRILLQESLRKFRSLEQIRIQLGNRYTIDELKAFLAGSAEFPFGEAVSLGIERQH